MEANTPAIHNLLEQAFKESPREKRSKKRYSKKLYRKKETIPDYKPNMTPAKKNLDPGHKKGLKDVCQVTCFNCN